MRRWPGLPLAVALEMASFTAFEPLVKQAGTNLAEPNFLASRPANFMPAVRGGGIRGAIADGQFSGIMAQTPQKTRHEGNRSLGCQQG